MPKFPVAREAAMESLSRGPVKSRSPLLAAKADKRKATATIHMAIMSLIGRVW